jgi:hypothetical protein
MCTKMKNSHYSVTGQVQLSNAVSNPATSGNSCYSELLLQLQLIYDRQSIGQSVLVSGAHLGPVTNFSFSLKFPLDSCGFVILYLPL